MLKMSYKKFSIFPANIDNIGYFYDYNINKLDKYLYSTDIICKNLNFYINNNDYEIILLGFLYND